jgi:hypothetical protein
LIEEREAVTEKLYDRDTALMTSPSPKRYKKDPTERRVFFALLISKASSQ